MIKNIYIFLGLVFTFAFFLGCREKTATQIKKTEVENKVEYRNYRDNMEKFSVENFEYEYDKVKLTDTTFKYILRQTKGGDDIIELNLNTSDKVSSLRIYNYDTVKIRLAERKIVKINGVQYSIFKYFDETIQSNGEQHQIYWNEKFGMILDKSLGWGKWKKLSGKYSHEADVIDILCDAVLGDNRFWNDAMINPPIVAPAN